MSDVCLAGLELGGGRRFPRAVDPGLQRPRGRVVEVERLGSGRERGGEDPPENWAELVGARDRPEHDLFARAVREVGGERGAQVGRDEELLELRVERLTDPPLRLEHRAEAVREMLLRPPEPLAQPVPETPEERHWPSEGRTSRAIAAPLRPSGGRRWPFSSRVTPPALPMLRTNGRFETHSRTSDRKSTRLNSSHSQ